MTTVAQVGLVVLIAAFGFPHRVAAQVTPMSDTSVKAAFLYNFAKFTDWKADGLRRPLALCVVDDAGIAGALVETVRSKRIGTQGLDVRQISSGEPVDACDVVFIPASETRRSAAALRSIRQHPVLTVSDGKGFADADGIVEFFAEGGRIRFAINTDAADRAGLHLSSRLLGLARIVKDNDAR